LMIAGIEKYYQFARCLRDEDLRQDRQPEHTQMDLEMSFVDEKDIMRFVEGLYRHIFRKILNIKLRKFPILPYKDCMNKYGSDKPDIRFELLLKDITEIAKKSESSIFKNVAENGGIVKCIIPEKDFSRGELDDLTKFCQEAGAKGLAWMKIADGKLDGGMSKFFPPELQQHLLKSTQERSGTILIIADKEKKANEVLNKLRLKLGKDLGLINEKDFRFCWVVDFPLFEWNEDDKKWDPAHHMFSMPKKECLSYLESDPGKVIANLYDVVLNGTELGSGSMRIHDPEIQERVMKIIGLSKEDAHKKFGFLLEAYQYGSPMHGGMGLGFDRLVAMMLGTSDIREVIAFPKNKQAENPMDGCPGDIDQKQRDELRIKSA